MEAKESRGAAADNGKEKAEKLTGDTHEMSSNFKSDVDNDLNTQKGTLPGGEEHKGKDASSESKQMK